ncbi:hypothetical protein [Cupriavidus necator]
MSSLVNLREMVDFCDAAKTARPHSSAIKGIGHEEVGVALLVEYFRSLGLSARVLDASCTALNGGAWLDKWVEVLEHDHVVHYQVEVKSWSFHGYGGGTALPVDCTQEELSEFTRKEFLRYWDDTKGRFRAPGLDKVLKEMKTQHAGEVRPLACLWTPIHYEGKDEPLFVVDNVQDSLFEKVWVFSASAFARKYLREKKTDIIELELPHTAARLEYLDRIFPRGTAPATTSPAA